MNEQSEWARVVYVEGSGYDCDETATGRDWSARQCHATKRGKAEADTRAEEFRAAGAHATVIRLRPQAALRAADGN